ncbi:MAG: peptidoglycan DD-metalloendopeptidase family protein [Acidimicrobiia bacterium]|nr:peptidoglycan DD-metalloendopeptidase family protein [Acidimicrobiia bacterium]
MTLLHPRPTIRLLTAAVLLVLTAMTVAPAPARADNGNGTGDHGSSTEELGDGTNIKADYDEVLGQEAKLEQAADIAAQRRAALAVQMAGAQKQLDATRLQLEQTTSVFMAKVRARNATRSKLRAAEHRLAVATAELRRQAISSYVAGGTDHETLAVVVASTNDVSATGRTLSYASAVVDHQNALVREFTAARKARDRVAARAEAAAQSATDARDGVAKVASDQQGTVDHLDDLAKQEAQAAAWQELALQQLRGRKVEIEARVVSLEKESDSIGLLLAERQKDQPAYTPGSITFRAPLAHFTVGSGFGMRMHPILHYTRLHAGQDLDAPAGTPIMAAASGTVLVAGLRGGYGNCVVIGHGHGIATVYAHQSRLLVQVGDEVKAGDVIGAVGTTGLSTGPHLHFETRVKGVPVDPTNFIDLEGVAEASRATD